MTVIELSEYATHIRENVRLVMNHKHITNQQIADQIGLSLSQVQDRTTLKTQGKPKADWSAPELAAVAEVLDVPVLVFYLTPDEAWDWITSTLGKPRSAWRTITPGRRRGSRRNSLKCRVWV